ncbi:MAG: glycosyltransferase family 39 protein [Anaerolineales bacterium]|nr:glycosyltransferase family 39 protein [Anaerolineales bacterium]MCB9172453.1 glycosyltransferase family 39 protein [Ardenticatenales bacterium]
MRLGHRPRPALTPRWPIFAFTLLAAALQWWVLDAQSLWYDEGFSIWLAQQAPAEIIARTANDIHPPLYYLLLHGWMTLTGSSEWTVRFFSAFFGTLSVPLIGRLGHRLLRSPRAATFAALLTALSPLWLWYAREARMYTLLLVLVTALGWLWPEVAERRKPRWGGIVRFAALALLAVYVHFYAWFVVAAFAFATLLAWLGARPDAAVRRWLLAFAMPLVAYLPWLGIVLRRLGQDRSYWEGMLPLRPVIEQTLGTWMSGHAMFEAQATLWGWVGLGLALLGLLALIRRNHERSLPVSHTLLLIAWLLVPVILLYALSWNRPKFHPRYLILSAPAFILLLSAWLGGVSRTRLRWLLTPLSLAALLVPFLIADYNTHLNPAFAKADWRGVATTLVQERQPDEPLILVSGHAFPVLAYYYPDAADTLRLPADETLDTTSVLAVEDAASLVDAIQQARSLWVVGWQQEVVDPDGIVRATIGAAGGSAEPTPNFKEVRLDHWTLPFGADGAAGLLRPTPQDGDFGRMLRLVGTRFAPTATDSGLWAQLYWQAQQPLHADLKVQATVVNEEGHPFGSIDQRPTSYNNPTFRWQPGVTHLADWQIPLDVGTPPGDYWLLLTVYDEQSGPLNLLDANGTPVGQQLRVGPISLRPAQQGWRDAPLPERATPLDRSLGDVTLRGVALPTRTVEAGQPVPMTLWWRAEVPWWELPEAALERRVQLGWQQGDLAVTGDAFPLAPGMWNQRRMVPGDQVAQPMTIRVPATLGAGKATLMAWLSEGGRALTDPVPVADFTLQPTTRNYDLPALGVEQRATFGDLIAMAGYDLTTNDAGLTLTVAWQSLAETTTSYTAFAHVLDSAGRIVPSAAQDALPPRPTDRWLTGEVVTQQFTLALPPDLPPDYQIEVGWYNAADPALPRLAAQGAGADTDRVLLTQSK